MYDDIRRVFGQIHVTQTDKNIIVEGVSSSKVIEQIIAYWDTKRITKYIFTYVKRSSFAFPRFFAPEFVYVLNKLIENPTLKTDVRTISQLRNKILENTYLADVEYINTQRLDLKKLSDIPMKPLEYQLRFLEHYSSITEKYSLNGALLNAAPGSGKTYASLVAAQLSGADVIVVVCPANVISQAWEEHILDKTKVFKETPSYWHSKMGRQYNGEKILIVNYEDLPRIITLLRIMVYKKMFIILDEAHNLSGMSAQRTQDFIAFCDRSKSKDIIIMSGTLVKALVKELIPFFKCIDKSFNEDAEERFRLIFKDNEDQAMDILNHRMGIVAFTVESHEIGLPEPIIQEHKVKANNSEYFTLREISKRLKAYTEERIMFYRDSMEDNTNFYNDVLSDYVSTITTSKERQHYDLYNRTIRDIQRAYNSNSLGKVAKEMAYCNTFEKKVIMKWLSGERKERFNSVRTIIKYVGLKIRGEALANVIGRARIDATNLIAKSIDYTSFINLTEKKTLVFTNYSEVVEESNQALINLGYTPMMIYGKTNKNFDENINKFKQDPSINPAIATYLSLSTGVPITEADVTLFLDVPFRTHIFEQTIARTRRKGANTQMRGFICILDTGTEQNITDRTLDIMKWSQEQVEAILGIKTPYEIVEADIAVTDSNSSVGFTTTAIEDLKFPFERHAILSTNRKIMTKWKPRHVK